MNTENVARHASARNGAPPCSPPIDIAAAWSALPSVRTDPSIASWLRAFGIEPGAVDRLGLARAGTNGRLALPLLGGGGEFAGLHVVDASGRQRRPVTIGAGVLACGLLVRALAMGGAWPRGASHSLVAADGAVPFLRRAAAAPRGTAVLGLVGRLPGDVAARVPAGTAVQLWCSDEVAVSIAARLRRTCRITRGCRP